MIPARNLPGINLLLLPEKKKNLRHLTPMRHYNHLIGVSCQTQGHYNRDPRGTLTYERHYIDLRNKFAHQWATINEHDLVI